jgi:hypothetical protein
MLKGLRVEKAIVKLNKSKKSTKKRSEDAVEDFFMESRMAIK